MLRYILVLVALLIGFIRCEQEHKVHNIILYPEKHSWCQTTPIRQVVALPGYEPITIDNNICVGGCYSYSIPSTQPAEPGEIIRPYCDSCQPSDTKCYHVTLHADKSNMDRPATFQKRVQIIMNCSCMSCDQSQKTDDCNNTPNQQIIELPSDLFANRTQNSAGNQLSNTKLITDDIPELLHFIPNNKNRTIPISSNKFKYETNSTSSSSSTNNNDNGQHFELNAKLISFLKSIQGNNDDNNDRTSDITYDKNQLRDLLMIIEGSERELTDKNLMEFVNFVNIHNSDDFELDLVKLKDVLVNFKKSQTLLEKHRDFGLNQAQKNNKKIIDDINDYKLPLTFGLEGVPVVAPAGQPNIKTNLIQSEETTTVTEQQLEQHHQHHHLGEEVHVHGLNVGHLVKGPHGSMVLAKVEEKFNIDSDVLKPNHDGVIIDYENHNKKTIDAN